MHNVTTWQRIVQTMKTRLINASFNLAKNDRRLTESSIKRYNCEEITGKYLDSLYKLDSPELFLEERDQQMANYIHSLLKRSQIDRYFFAIGAGRNTYVFE